MYTAIAKVYSHLGEISKDMLTTCAYSRYVLDSNEAFLSCKSMRGDALVLAKTIVSTFALIR